ncbi:NTF2-related export protein 2 [Biomphalaria glabrata]|uniref:NTF2-related export protein n=2 Tax=Biomphalaria TaxID=6525 RepID=A0A2C9K0Q7_BIOGL|nr:NTF2-related export protein 2 [Biomphalaria glabrata]KAI8761786.1 NTF2-related export protein 2 [Biomphalaria glabrata]
MLAEDIKAKSFQATIAAGEFSKLYFETFDKRRQAIIKMYQEKATLVWNGHYVSGADEIMKFFDKLPQSEYTVEGMDTQPILADTVSKGINSIIVTVFGKVKFKESEKKVPESKVFAQTFILSAHDNKWKIDSDNMRFMD